MSHAKRGPIQVSCVTLQEGETREVTIEGFCCVDRLFLQCSGTCPGLLRFREDILRGNTTGAGRGERTTAASHRSGRAAIGSDPEVIGAEERGSMENCRTVACG